MVWAELRVLLAGFWHGALDFTAEESEEQLRRRLLLPLILVSTPWFVAATICAAILWVFRQHISLNLNISAFDIAGMVIGSVAWLAISIPFLLWGRRMPSWLSAIPILAFWLTFFTVSELPQNTALGTNAVFFALLVSFSGFVFPTYSVFIVSGISIGILSITALSLHMAPPIWQITGLIGMALFCWLSAAFSERTRMSLRSLNASLEQRIQVRTAELERSAHNLNQINQEMQLEIVRRQVLEGQLRLAKDEAESASQIKSQFLANMSHEIRTPMTAVLGFAEILRHTPLSSEQRDYLTTICRSGELLTSLINDILDLSKIEAGQMVLEDLDFDLEQLLAALANIVRHHLLEKHLDLRMVYPAGLSRRFRGDPTRLQQVLLNLLNNAIKFTPRGEIVITVDPGASSETRISIKDTGIGIPRDRLQAIFDSFTQGDSSITRRYGGTGLGLAISKQIIARMGGGIEVLSQEGVGSEFILTLPLRAAREQARPAGPAPDGAITPGVLLLGDDPVAVSLLASYCQETGAQVLARTGAWAEAWAWLEGNAARTGLVFCSLSGPEAESLLWLARARSAWGHLRWVALTAEGSAPAAGRTAPAGDFDARLTKPLQWRDFLKVLHATLGALPAQRNDPLPGPVRTGPEVRTARVLVAEDNAINQELLRILLGNLGYQAVCVNDGRAAVESLRAQAFDLVLMDVQMPEMDGLQATRMIRSELKLGLPILALTAHTLQQDLDRCLQAGMDDHLSKPIDLNELRGKLAAWTIHRPPHDRT